MATPALTPRLAADPEWYPMQCHVRTYLGGHPLLRGFGLATRADEEGITAELRDSLRSVTVVHAESGWWRPCTPQHGREIADRLARDLYARWMERLRCG